MKVILLKDIPHVGRKNDTKEVSDGYARNFLIPRALAKPATDQALNTLAIDQKYAAEREAHLREKYENWARKAGAMTLDFPIRVGEKGKAFGSVNAAKIFESLKQHGFEIEKDWIRLDEPIKSTGEKVIELHLPHGVKAKVNIKVTAE